MQIKRMGELTSTAFHQGRDTSALRQQIRVLEQEYNRLSAKKDLSEAEKERKKQIERKIERLRQQLKRMEQNKIERSNRAIPEKQSEPGKGNNVDEWR